MRTEIFVFGASYSGSVFAGACPNLSVGIMLILALSSVVKSVFTYNHGGKMSTNKKQSAVRICEIVDGVLSILWGICCFLALEFAGILAFPYAIAIILTLLLIAMACYYTITGLYIAIKGCNGGNVGKVKIVVSAVFGILSLMNVMSDANGSTISTFIFYLFVFALDLCLLGIVPDKFGNDTSKENAEIGAQFAINEILRKQSLTESQNAEKPQPAPVQKYVKCPICGTAYIKEDEKCCADCKSEAERIESLSVVRIITAKSQYDGKAGYRIMDEQWRCVGIIPLDRPNDSMLKIRFFEPYKNDFARFAEEFRCNGVRNQAEFEKKLLGVGYLKIKLSLKTQGQEVVETENDSEETNLIFAETSREKNDSDDSPAMSKTAGNAPGSAKLAREQSADFGLADEEFKREFRDYLEYNASRDYSPNTINSYVSAINKVARWEHTDWQGVFESIGIFELEYSQYGPKSERGEEGNATVRNALSRFKEFAIYRISKLRG